jgi:uncharacterized protein involved in exopolysaccharide biosynthesis
VEQATTSRPSIGVLLLGLQIFFRHTMLFVLSFLLCLVGVAVFTVVTKPQYRSEMKLIMQSTRSNAIISPDRANSTILTSVSEEQLNTELEILQSEDVVSKVADPTWDPGKAAGRSQADRKAHSKLLTYFTKHLIVDPIGKSDVMSMSFTAGSAVEARDALVSLSAAYLVQHEALQRRTGTLNFYEEETARYKQDWVTAVQKLVDFQQLHQLVSVAEIEDKLQKAIGDDEAAQRINETHISENTAGMRKEAAVLLEVPARQQSQRRAMPSQLLVQQLKTEQVSLNNHRTELLTRYTPTNRLVTEVDQQLIDTTAAIKVAAAEKSYEDTTDINPPWQHLKTSMVQGQVEYESLVGGRKSLEHELQLLRAELADVQLLSPEFEQLRSTSEQAQANYEAFMEKRDRASVEDAMDARKFQNVNMLESPTLPYTKIRPKPVLNALLGLPTAFFLALVLLYLAEAGRNTFTTPAEIEIALGRRVLATLPYQAAIFVD